MKLSTALRVKRTQFMRWVKDSTRNSSSTAPFMLVESGSYTDRRIFVLRQLIRKFKSQLKKWQTSPQIRYSYDLKSYSQNFDDGFLDQ